jgi:hypothetical protein
MDEQRQQEQQQPKRKSALEVRNTYGAWTGVLFVAIILFGYDGWFSETMREKGHSSFNQIMTAVWVILFIFTATRTCSAALAVHREAKQPPPPAEPPTNPPVA